VKELLRRGVWCGRRAWGWLAGSTNYSTPKSWTASAYFWTELPCICWRSHFAWSVMRCKTVMPQIASSAAVSADPRRSLRRNAFYPSEIDGALLL